MGDAGVDLFAEDMAEQIAEAGGEYDFFRKMRQQRGERMGQQSSELQDRTLQERRGPTPPQDGESAVGP